MAGPSLCGHDHDYERSYPVRGVDQEATLRPAVVALDTTEVDTSYYHAPAATRSNLNPAPIVYDSFTAVRRRRDGFGGRRPGAPQEVHA
ncbi:MAG: hypothetical protein ACLQFR_13425 [Streptosporangiaceae bacterium]